MAFDQDIRKRDAIADGAIGTALILKLGTAGRDHVVVAGANAIPIGVSPSGTHDRDTSNAADTDDQFEMYYGGLVKVNAGAAVAVGDYVKADAAGKAIPVLTVVSSGPQNHLGIAINAAANADEIITVQIEIGVRSFIT